MINKMINKERYLHYLTFISLASLAFFLFISFSLSSISHHAFIILPGLWFLFKAIKEKNVNFSASAWALLALVIVTIIGIVLNASEMDRPLRTAMKLRYFLVGILLIFVLRYRSLEFFNPKRIRLLINLFLIGATVATISGLIGLYSGFNPLRMQAACHETRNCGMYGMFITYGYSIHFFCLILIALWVNREKMQYYVNKYVLYSAILINFVGFYLSYTRGALLGLIIATPFFFFRKNKKKFAVVAVILFIISSVSLLAIPQIRAFVTHIDRVTSTNHRLSQYYASWIVFKESPFFGVGYRNFEPMAVRIKQEMRIPYEWRGGHAHSNFFEHLATTGAFGFLALLLFHLFWMRESYGRHDEWGDFSFVFALAVFVSGQFQYTLGDGENLLLVMMIYALSQIREPIS